MKWVFVFALVLATSCGSDDDGDEDSDDDKLQELIDEEKELSQQAKPPSSSIEMTVFGQSMHVDDELYELSCNQFFVSYWTDRSSPKCTAVVAESHLEFDPERHYWTVTSTNSQWELDEVDGEEKLIHDGTEYYCYLYSGSLYKDDGEEIVYGSHLVLADAAADKPSDLNQESIYAIAFNDSEGCTGFEQSGESE